MAGWVTWQQQIWAADKGGGEGGSPSWPVLLWCPEASRAASLLCCQPMSLSRTILTLSQLQSLHHSILTLPALTHPTRTGFLLKHTGYLLSCQLQMNLSVLGTCGGVWNGMADDWVLLDVSLLQSKQAQTEIKTEPSFCLPSSYLTLNVPPNLSHKGFCDVTGLLGLKSWYTSEETDNRNRYLSFWGASSQFCFSLPF